MNPENRIIASGNLATSRRTIMGVLVQCALLRVADVDARSLLTGAGLPRRALDELDFPISLDQDLVICNALLHTLAPGRSPAVTLFNTLDKMGINNLGVLGMAMRHADTVSDALRICMTYPQLTWGHSRLIVRQQAHLSVFSFSMARPERRDISGDQVDRLVEYCLVLDLLTSLRNIETILESSDAPLYISFEFAQPADWGDVTSALPCPVHFSASETCLAYPARLDDMPLPQANALIYRSYVAIAHRQSQMLPEDTSLKERVTRWLWAYTPPPKRGEIASLLSMSERSLTRQLRGEDTCYSQLLASVQEERAKNFLRNPALSVSEISNRLGYAEAAAFSRAFSHWTGESPLHWRKQSER